MQKESIFLSVSQVRKFTFILEISPYYLVSSSMPSHVIVCFR